LLRHLGITVRSNTIRYMTCRHKEPYGTLKLGLCDKKVGCVYGRKVTFALAISMLVTSWHHYSHHLSRSQHSPMSRSGLPRLGRRYNILEILLPCVSIYLIGRNNQRSTESHSRDCVNVIVAEGFPEPHSPLNHSLRQPLFLSVSALFATTGGSIQIDLRRAPCLTPSISFGQQVLRSMAIASLYIWWDLSFLASRDEHSASESLLAPATYLYQDDLLE
jgi:hypothetical protein